MPSSINSGNGLDPLVMVIIPCNSQALADVKNELNTGKMNHNQESFFIVTILIKYTYRLHTSISFTDSDEPLDLTVKKSVVSIHDEDGGSN